MSRSQTQINAQQQQGSAELQDAPTNPMIWLLLLAAVMVAGVWWFGNNRDNQSPIVTEAAPPTTERAAAEIHTESTKPAKPVAAHRASPKTAVVTDRAPALIAGTAQPKYPPSALRAGVYGTVTLVVLVDEQGEPSRISITQRSGNRDLDRAALKAASDWRFKPALHHGKAVTAEVKVPVEFSLQ